MRNTPIHTALLGIFQGQQKPFSVKDILIALRKKGLIPNKTTVYRQLERLEEQKIIRRIQISEGESSYEKADSHHHHFICINCKKIEDFHMPEEEKILKKALVSKKDFVFLTHQFEIFGKCASCTIK
jgi:Fe2+ or Zn2+ uptake regulation protein